MPEIGGPAHLLQLPLQDPDGAGEVDLSETRADVLARMLDDGRRYIQRCEPDFRRLCGLLGGPAPRPPGRALHVAVARVPAPVPVPGSDTQEAAAASSSLSSVGSVAEGVPVAPPVSCESSDAQDGDTEAA